MPAATVQQANRVNKQTFIITGGQKKDEQEPK